MKYLSGDIIRQVALFLSTNPSQKNCRMGKFQLKKLSVSGSGSADMEALYKSRPLNHDLFIVIKEKPSLAVLAEKPCYPLPVGLNLAASCTYFKVSGNKIRVLYQDRSGTLFCKKYLVAEESQINAVFRSALKEVFS